MNVLKYFFLIVFLSNNILLAMDSVGVDPEVKEIDNVKFDEKEDLLKILESFQDIFGIEGDESESRRCSDYKSPTGDTFKKKLKKSEKRRRKRRNAIKEEYATHFLRNIRLGDDDKTREKSPEVMRQKNI